MKIEHTLTDLGVDDSRIDEVVRQAENDPTAGSNAVPLNQDNLRGMFVNALQGRLA